MKRDIVQDILKLNREALADEKDPAIINMLVELEVKFRTVLALESIAKSLGEK